MRLGTSRTWLRRAKVRRVRGASAVAKAATPLAVGVREAPSCALKGRNRRGLTKIAQRADRGRRKSKPRVRAVKLSRTPPRLTAYVARSLTQAATTIG